jgi:hypothetical protein
MSAILAAWEATKEFATLLFENWKLVAIAALLAAAPIGFYIGQSRGDTAGYNRRIAEVAARDAKAELERKNDNAKLQNSSDYDLCVLGLRGSSLPIDACQQLRGVPAKQSQP